jgi:hypothetical protein
VTVEVVPPPPNTAVVFEYTEAKGCSICFAGEPGTTWVLQGTEDLLPSFTWTDLSTNQVPQPSLRVTDPTASGTRMRYYRFEILE